VALQKIKFQTNIPVEMALKFAEGKLCDSQFGDPQYMFTTTDDRVFFVAEKVATKIHGLHLQPREPFDMTKAEVDYGNGRKGIEWRVAKVGFVPGEQPDGTFAIDAIGGSKGKATVETVRPPRATDQLEADILRSLAELRAKQAGANVSASAPVAAATEKAPQDLHKCNNNGNGNTNGAKPQTKLADALKTAVEAAHAAGEYAKTIGYAAMPQFTSEDLRCMANTILINGAHQ
jgi:hypothetical protein